jgi:DNA-binding LytR/AlgR family response regulator
VIGFYEELLKQSGFLRCHRSYLVNERHVHKFNSQHLIIEEEEIPLGKKYVEFINERLLHGKFKAYR